MRTRIKALLPIILAVAVVFVFDLPLLLPGRIALDGDATLIFYPYEHELARALANGTLPFWTPAIQAGFPLLAEPQSAGFYPPNWLLLATLPTPIAHDAALLIHQLLGFTFAYAWARTLVVGRAVAATLAVLFVLTTGLVGSSVPLSATTAWIPLVFLATARAIRAESACAAWPLAPVIALQWLAGYPQIALYSLAFAGTFAALGVLEVHAAWPVRVRALAGWLTAVAVGLALAAPQLLASYELSEYSLRASGVPERLAGEQSLFPLSLLVFLLPSWRPFFHDAGLGFSAYVGIVPLALAVATLVVKPRPRAFRPLLAVTLLSALLALGAFGPIFPLIRRLPGFASFRLPSRALVFTQFGLLTFFAIGLDGCLRPGNERLRTVARWVLGASIVLMALNAAVVHQLASLLRPELTQLAETYVRSSVLTNPFHMQPMAYYQDKIARLLELVLAASDWTTPTVFIPLFVAVAGWWLLRPSLAGRGGRLLWGGVIVVDALAVAGWVKSAVPEATVTVPPPTVALTARDAALPCRIYSLTDDRAVTFEHENLVLLPANYQLLFGVESTGIYSPLAFATYYDLMKPLGGVNLGFGNRPVTARDVEEARPLLDLLNVCTVLSREPLVGFAPAGEAASVSVYRNDRRLARAFVVDQVEVAGPDAASVLSVLRAHRDRLRNTAVLAEPLPVALDLGAAAGAAASVTAYGPTDVEVEVSTPGTVLLVLSDTFYPGWEATMDGSPVAIHRADAVFRGVVVSPGRHRIHFRYWPTFFWRSVGVAAVGAAVWLGWAMFVTAFRSPSTPERQKPLMGKAQSKR